MIELAQHIEALLLENDCVMIPGLGGFVAHYSPSSKATEENVFLPPLRKIGFNPCLKMNDGLLVQSYAAVYGTNFSDATRMVERHVNQLLDVLHVDGKADLPNVGELHYSIYGTFTFIPYDHKLTTPYLYGMDSFEMQKLAPIALKPATKMIEMSSVPQNSVQKQHRKIHLPIKRSYLSNAVAVLAAAVIFLLMSSPIENTRVVEENYAHLLPSELFEKIGTQSLLFTAVPVGSKTKEPVEQKQKQKQRQESAKPITTKEIKVKADKPAVKETSQPERIVPQSITKSHHIIVASMGTEQDANHMVQKLKEQGYSNARTIIGNGKIRVSVQSFNSQQEAYTALNKIRSNAVYKNAWVLKQTISL